MHVFNVKKESIFYLNKQKGKKKDLLKWFYYEKKEFNELLEKLDQNITALPEDINKSILEEILLYFNLKIEDITKSDEIFMAKIKNIDYKTFSIHSDIILSKIAVNRFVKIFNNSTKSTFEISQLANLNEYDLLDILNCANLQIKEEDYNPGFLIFKSIIYQALNAIGWHYEDIVNITHQEFNKKLDEYKKRSLNPVVSKKIQVAENRALRIKMIREKLSYIQEELAKLIGVETFEISIIEKEVNSETFNTLFKFFNLFNKDYPEFSNVILTYSNADFEIFINEFKV